MKVQKNASFLKVIILVITLLVIGSLINIFFYYSNNWVTKTLTVRQSSVENLANVVWSVQATVTTLSIALMSVIINFNKEKAYGIKLLDFILIHQKKLLNFYELILVTILLILIEYFVIAFLLYPLFIFLFSVSLLVILNMVKTSLKITLSEEQIFDEIKLYVIEKLENQIDAENKENHFEVEKTSKRNEIVGKLFGSIIPAYFKFNKRK